MPEVGEDAEELYNLHMLQFECNMVQPLMKTVLPFLEKLNIYSPNEPAISLLGIYPREM